MPIKSFDVYNDPGHGWVKVPLALLKKLGIENQISCYSYMRGAYAYLEEDCDTGVLVGALKETGVESIAWREHTADKQSKIRNYEVYCAHTIDWDKCVAK